MAGRCSGSRSPPSRYFVGLGILFGVCLARSRLRAELLPHPQRVFVVVAVILGYLSTYEGEVRIALTARRSERRAGPCGYWLYRYLTKHPEEARAVLIAQDSS